jgi:hypothetical protein
MGVQPNSAKKTEREHLPIKYSPRYRAAQAADHLKDQCMILSGGSAIEYNELMRGDIDFYLRKFEANIKAQK